MILFLDNKGWLFIVSSGIAMVVLRIMIKSHPDLKLKDGLFVSIDNAIQKPSRAYRQLVEEHRVCHRLG